MLHMKLPRVFPTGAGSRIPVAYDKGCPGKFMVFCKQAISESPGLRTIVTTRLLGLLQETNNTKVYPKRQGLICKFPKFQFSIKVINQSSQTKFSIGVFSCSLPL